MQNPLVSILTPFKNTESFLTECISSIIRQSYTNWELLIVDDFSTDNSYQLVESFAKQDNRIKLFKNTEAGIIGALQLAFKQSNGDFITRMDSDDIMHHRKIETLVNNLMSHEKHHVAIGLVKYFSEEGLGDGYQNYETWINALTKTGNNFSEIYKECVIPSPCWMMHRDDLIACGAFNSTRLPEDYDLTFRLYEQRYQCLPCHEVLHYWRDYSTRSSRTQEHYAQIHFLDLKLHYFLKLDYDISRPLAVWGAGTKGKKAAKILIEHGVNFYWICNNPKKIGRDIYGQHLYPFNHLKTLKNPQSIITVANKEAQDYVRNYMKDLNMKPMTDYFFFC